MEFLLNDCVQQYGTYVRTYMWINADRCYSVTFSCNPNLLVWSQLDNVQVLFPLPPHQ